MGLFEKIGASKIKGDPKKRTRKPVTMLFAIATQIAPFSHYSGMNPRPLDLSPFSVPAEQMYVLTTEIEG